MPPSYRAIMEVIKYSVIALIIVAPVRLFVAQPFIVSGASMEPTFDPKEYLVIDRLSYRYGEPERGDVVIFRYPLDPSIFYIKRIIGLPGETVEVKDGMVFVRAADGAEPYALTEPYVSSAGGKKNARATRIEEGEYFVMGDNRDQSADSRVWGPLSERFIIGRALARLYPLQRVEVLPGEYRFEQADRAEEGP